MHPDVRRASADPGSRTRCDIGNVVRHTTGTSRQPIPVLGPAATVGSPARHPQILAASADPGSRTRCDRRPASSRSCVRAASADPGSRTRCDRPGGAESAGCYAASADPGSRTRCDCPSRKPFAAKPLQRPLRAVRTRRGCTDDPRSPPTTQTPSKKAVMPSRAAPGFSAAPRLSRCQRTWD